MALEDKFNSSDATPEEIASLVSTPVDETASLETPKTEKELGETASESTVTKMPTLTAVMSRMIGESSQFGGAKYAEEQDERFLNNAVGKANVVRSKLQKLGDESPEARSQIGGNLGAGIGAAIDGPIGALVGAGVGAMSARGMGLVKSGEREDMIRKDKLMKSLQVMGVANKDSRISFDDGDSFLLTPDPYAKLPNTSSIFGEAERSIFQMDKTNPFTQRTAALARPLARYMAEGVLGYKDDKSPRDVKVVDNTTALFVNALQDNSDSMEKIYSRARQLADKMGVTEHDLRVFYDANKTRIPGPEAVEIRKGLDLIYA